ncbi:unnamed protein product [Peniophora sp. CBMAI 1063]|nr:unnamed protein product [Peniophora sp. CBMAI 1063]
MPAARLSIEQDVGDVSRDDIAATGMHTPVSDAENAVEDSAQYDLPSFLSASTSRVRRRSELAFARNGKERVRDEHTHTFELPALSPDAIARSRQMPPQTQIELLEQEDQYKEDLSAGPSSLVPSLRYAPSRTEGEGASYPPSVHVAVARTPAHRRIARLQFATFCFSFFLEGWNDGSTGPLLPTIQAFYGLNYAVVSMVFILNAVGFILGAATLVLLVERFGMGKVASFGAFVQLIAYAMQVPAGPFPEFAVSFTLAGFGLCMQNALGNAFVGGQAENTATMLGLLHGAYGLGAFAAPLLATHFSTQTHWSYHYITSLVLAAVNFTLLTAVFRFKTQEAAMQEAGYEPAPAEANRGSQYGAILSIRAVYFLAAFVLIYVGVEVTLGGWIVTFIIRERAGGPSSGYISSGFFGGLTVGRVTLLWLNKRIGETRALTIYAILCIALEVTVWAVPSLIENAIAVSMIGLLMGPMYPIMVGHTSKILPRFVLNAALGLINGLGQTGSALLPFLTGVLASKFGITSLQPLVVSMMALMTVIWFAIPKGHRRQE